MHRSAQTSGTKARNYCRSADPPAARLGVPGIVLNLFLALPGFTIWVLPEGRSSSWIPTGYRSTETPSPRG